MCFLHSLPQYPAKVSKCTGLRIIVVKFINLAIQFFYIKNHVIKKYEVQNSQKLKDV